MSNSKMQNPDARQWKKLLAFAYEHAHAPQAKPGNKQVLTHTCKTEDTKGKFYFSTRSREYHIFLRSICELVNSGQVHGFLEMPCAEMPYRVDIDIDEIDGGGNPINCSTKHLYSKADKNWVIRTIQNILGDLFETTDGAIDFKKCVVLEKSVGKRPKNGRKYMHDGFHLHFPNAVIGSAQWQRLDKEAKQRLAEIPDLFYGCKWEFDTNIRSSAWYMMGGTAGKYAYEITQRLSANRDEQEISQFWGRFPDNVSTVRNQISKIKDIEEYQDDRMKDLTFLEPLFMSIRDRPPTLKFKKFILDEIKKKKEKEDKKKEKILDESSTTNIPKIFGVVDERCLETIRSYLDNLPNIDIEWEQWRNIGWSIRSKVFDSEQDLENSAYQLFDEWSSTNPKYDSTKTREIWDSYEKKQGGITLGTLDHYVKKANPENYEKIKSQRSDKKMLKNLYAGEMGHSIIVANEWSKCVRVINEKGDGYEFSQITKLWEKRTCSQFIVKAQKMLMDLLIKERTRVNSLPRDEDGKKDQQMKIINKKIKTGEKRKHPANVFGLAKASDKIYDQEFEDKLNKIPNQLPLKNGVVIDLKTLSTRERKMEDMWSFECPVNYVGKIRPEVDMFFENMFGRLDKIEYFRKVFGYFLTGELEKLFFLAIGPTNAGKSFIVNLLNKILTENFGVGLERDVFIKSRDKNRHKGAASPHLVPLRHGRLGTCVETDENQVLDSELTKRISGGDMMNPRDLYERGKDIKPFTTQCKLLLVSNNPPIFDITDDAILERARYLNFEHQFVEVVTQPHHVKRDKIMASKIMNEYLDDAFSWFAIGSCMYYTNGLEEPDIVKQDMEKCKSNLDTVAQFIDECVEKIAGDDANQYREKRSTIQLQYYQYCKDNNLKGLTKLKFSSEFKKKIGLGEPRKVHGVYTYVGMRLLCDDGFPKKKESIGISQSQPKASMIFSDKERT
jgi:phage/plasmid-associated DNA primase